MYTHVISVGTSLIRNYARESGDSELMDLERGTKGTKDIEVEKKCKELLNYLDSDPYKASAELNAFLRKAEECEPEKVILLCTDTDAGELSCAALECYLRGKGYEVSTYVINDLGKPQRFYEGLINLMCAFPKIVDKEAKCPSKCLCVNPTGGFKPESATLYMLSLINNKTADVYYIHEAFRDVISLPIIPVVKTLSDVLTASNILWKGKEGYVKKLIKCWEVAAITPWRPLRYRYC